MQSAEQKAAESHRRIRNAVLIVCFNGRPFLEDCLASVLSDAGDDTLIVVVDNASTDESREFITRRFPEVILLSSDRNLGFAAGNNLGWRWIREQYPAVQFVVFLNQDTYVAAGWLRGGLDLFTRSPEIGAVQSKIRLSPETTLLNTAGNRSHYLGFGFLGGYREPDLGQFDLPVQIDFPSGASMFLRVEAIHDDAPFDDEFVAYLEDMELGWKLRQMGVQTWSAPESVVYHKYSGSAHLRNYYLLERNRWLLLLTYYSLSTLLLLFPPLVAMELVQWLFAARNGLAGERFRLYCYFCKCSNIRRLLRQRRKTQRRRRIRDREFSAKFLGTISDARFKRSRVWCSGNLVLGAYWEIARRCMWW